MNQNESDSIKKNSDQCLNLYSMKLWNITSKKLAAQKSLSYQASANESSVLVTRQVLMEQIKEHQPMNQNKCFDDVPVRNPLGVKSSGDARKLPAAPLTRMSSLPKC